MGASNVTASHLLLLTAFQELVLLSLESDLADMPLSRLPRPTTPAFEPERRAASVTATIQACRCY